MPIRVSVIVPVYNPGPYIDDCVRSILDQSLGRDAVEAILVDDGSTDDTPARLDAYAATYPNIRVIHQENSGWPGKPRNVGLDAARGDYVFFLDNDDTLGGEALERMVDVAEANRSDVVLGKMAGFHRAVPRSLFFENRPNATLDDTPLMDGLTPHKLFRRSFVASHGLRFPEGRRRLEDHVFVVGAYFLAERISVLSDYVCYYHIRREDRSNAGLRRFDPKGYYDNLREVIGIIEAHTEPGPRRDRLLVRTTTADLLGRLRDRSFLDHPQDYREALFAEIRSVVMEHIGPGVDPLLSPAVRTQLAVLRADRLDLMLELAAAAVEVVGTARLERLSSTKGRTLTIGFSAGLAERGAPLQLERRGTRSLLPVPERIAALVPDDARAVGPEDRATARLVARRRDDWAELDLPVTSDAVEEGERGGGDGRAAYRLTGILDPLTASVGRPIWPGTWDLFARVEAYGYSRDVRLGAVRDRRVRPGRHAIAMGPRPATRVVPYWTDPGDNLSLLVTTTPPRPAHRRVLSSIRRRLRRSS